jgi:hypothetical protein
MIVLDAEERNGLAADEDDDLYWRDQEDEE